MGIAFSGHSVPTTSVERALDALPNAVMKPCQFSRIGNIARAHNQRSGFGAVQQRILMKEIFVGIGREFQLRKEGPVPCGLALIALLGLPVPHESVHPCSLIN